MVFLPELNFLLVPKRPTSGLGYHNDILGTTAILKRQCVVWCKLYLDTSNRLGVDH